MFVVGGFERILLTKNNVLFFCIYLIFLSTTTITATTTTVAATTLVTSTSSATNVTLTTTTTLTLQNEMVPEDQWVCGATQWDRTLAYQKANESCLDVAWAINSCCVVHDTCYILDKSQAECDDPFCACLEEQAKRSNNPDCGQALEGFCFIVRLFGGIAHSNAKEKANSNLTLIESLTTELPITTTTTKSLITSTTEVPPRRLDTTEEECFSSELNNCVEEFETCQSRNRIELLQCEERMCQCTRSALRNKAKPECRYPIEMTCIIPDSSFPSPFDYVSENEESDESESFLSTKIVLFGFSTTLSTTLIILLITFLPISFVIWILLRYIKTKRSMPISPSRTPLFLNAASSAESGLACGSNDTLSSDEGVTLARYP